MVLHVAPDGTVRFLAGEAIDPGTLGVPAVRRASHVEPTGRARRAAFRAIRRVCGESGRAAAWTRRWAGPWRVDLAPSDGPTLGPFARRADAIAAEVAWLEEHRF